MGRVFTQAFGVCGAIIEREGKVLLARENLPGNPDDGKWSHPAGWIEIGEDPIDAARREVKEETGFAFEPIHLLGVYSLVRRDLAGFRGAAPHALKLIFTGKIGEHAKENLQGDTVQVKWFAPEEIFSMDEKTLRDRDIKQMVKDCLSGKRYPLEIIAQTVMF